MGVKTKNSHLNINERKIVRKNPLKIAFTSSYCYMLHLLFKSTDFFIFLKQLYLTAF